MSDLNKQAELSDKTDRAYDLMLMRFERWLDELATHGPSHVGIVLREIAKAYNLEPVRNDAGIDFNHQKGYN